MKKAFNIIKIAIVMVGAAIAVSCSTDAAGSYLRVSDSSFSLDGAGIEEFFIEVNASSSWTYTINDSWINEISCESTGLTVQADAYYGTDMRVGSITFETDAMTVKVTICQQNCLVTSVVNEIFAYGEPSPSGYYIAGMYYPDDYYAVPTRIDTRTGEVVYYDYLDNSLEVTAVDDNGNIYIAEPWFTEGGYIDASTGVYTAMEVPDDMVNGGVTGVSADGSVWVGFGCPEEGNWVPMKWVNGVPEQLSMPVTNGSGFEEIWYGVVARGCSDDGSIIYGSIMDYSEAIYWTKEGEVKFIGEELLEYSEGMLTAGARCNSDKQRISPNGKWLSFCYENNSTGVSYPGFIDLETEVVTVMEKYSGYDIMTISNDFEMVLFSSGYLQYTSILKADGTLMDSMDWIEEEYGLIIEDNRAITQIAANGNIAGYKYTGSTYVSWWLDRE